MLEACVLSNVGAHEKNPSWLKFVEPFICNSHNHTVDLGHRTPESIIKLLLVVDY